MKKDYQTPLEFYSNIQIDEKIKNLQSQINTIEDVNITCPGPIEVPCKAGPEGPAGPPGGNYSNQGPLRNLENVNFFAERPYNIGPSAPVILASQNFKPQQFWTLESDSQHLTNQYGNCLFGDTNTNLTYMSSCKSTPEGLQWIFDNNGRLKLKSEPNKCLTPVYEGIVKDKNNTDKYGKLMQLKLTNCDNPIPLNQQWAFY